MVDFSLSNFGVNLPNISGFGDKLLGILLVVLIIAIVGFGIFFYSKRQKKNKTGVMKKIGWWEEVHSELAPTAMDDAEEITIPGTRLKVFYIKSRDMWFPRFTRGITKDLFYVAITPQREIVNFTLGSISKDMEAAGLNYDHTDMLWPAENLRDYIKRNFRDKSQPWWKQYQGVITTAIYIIILTFSFVVILYFMRQIVGDLRGVVSQVGELLKQLNACYPQGSGISGA